MNGRFRARCRRDPTIAGPAGDEHVRDRRPRSTSTVGSTPTSVREAREGRGVGDATVGQARHVRIEADAVWACRNRCVPSSGVGAQFGASFTPRRASTPARIGHTKTRAVDRRMTTSSSHGHLPGGQSCGQRCVGVDPVRRCLTLGPPDWERSGAHVVVNATEFEAVPSSALTPQPERGTARRIAAGPFKVPSPELFPPRPTWRSLAVTVHANRELHSVSAGSSVKFHVDIRCSAIPGPAGRCSSFRASGAIPADDEVPKRGPAKPLGIVSGAK